MIDEEHPCFSCTLYRKADVLKREYKAMPDRLARLADNRAEIGALRMTNHELQSMTAAFIVAVFLWSIGGEQ